MSHTVWILLVVSLAWPAFARAGELGLVVSVHDGDTLTMRFYAAVVKIRLAEIDAPEAGQPFYIAARESLRALCSGQEAEFTETGYDGRNKRPVGRVTCRQTDAGTHMVRNGMAWVFDKYADPASTLYITQTLAREARRGLWVDPNPISPWEWRAARR